MSKKKETVQQIQYDPGSQSVFSAFQPRIQSVLSDWMLDPLKSAHFNLMLQRGLAANRSLGQRTTANILANLAAGGFGGGNMPAFAATQLARAGRAGSAGAANVFMDAMANALAGQQWATGLASAYRPLQTGQTETSKESGLGTWLPQILTAMIAGASNAFAPGMSMASNYLTGTNKNAGLESTWGGSRSGYWR